MLTQLGEEEGNEGRLHGGGDIRAETQLDTAKRTFLEEEIAWKRCRDIKVLQDMQVFKYC